MQHTGPTLPSSPHIAMTVAMLRQAGVDVDDSMPNRWQVRRGRVAAAAGTSNQTCPTLFRSSPRP
ncbi:EPSP synthase family protein [Mycobacterium xenopi 3993]|nr:EPSP synthase family protein [Mycobacterium xenopi 3993]